MRFPVFLIANEALIIQYHASGSEAVGEMGSLIILFICSPYELDIEQSNKKTAVQIYLYFEIARPVLFATDKALIIDLKCSYRRYYRHTENG